MKSKSRVSVWQMLLAAGLATAIHAINAQADVPPPVGPEAVEADETVSPEGDYALAHLPLKYDGDPPAQRLPLVFRQTLRAWQQATGDAFTVPGYEPSCHKPAGTSSLKFRPARAGHGNSSHRRRRSNKQRG